MEHQLFVYDKGVNSFYLLVLYFRPCGTSIEKATSDRPSSHRISSHSYRSSVFELGDFERPMARAPFPKM